MATAKELIAQALAKREAKVVELPPTPVVATPPVVISDLPITPEVLATWQPEPRVFTYYAAPKTKLEVARGTEIVFDVDGKYTTTESREFAILDSLVDRFPGHFRKQGE